MIGATGLRICAGAFGILLAKRSRSPFHTSYHLLFILRNIKRRLEREQGRHDAADDLSELSEGEKEKGDANQIEPSVSPIGSTVLS